MSKRVYLAGPISGLDYKGATDWRDWFTRSIDPHISCYSPLRGKQFLQSKGLLNGSYNHPLASQSAICNRDRNDCKSADLVVFNLLGATRVTIGTMIEVGWTDAYRVPSLLIMEPDNIHEHPILSQAMHFRTDNLEDALWITESILLPDTAKRTQDRIQQLSFSGFPTSQTTSSNDATGCSSGFAEIEMVERGITNG